MILSNIFREYPLFHQERVDKTPRQALLGFYLLHGNCPPRKALYEPCPCPQAPQKKWLHSPPTQELLRLQYLHNSVLGSRVHLKNYGNRFDAICKNASGWLRFRYGDWSVIADRLLCAERRVGRGNHCSNRQKTGKKQRSSSVGDWWSKLPVPGLHVHTVGDHRTAKE